MKSIQMKRRKRREKGQVSIKSVVCAVCGAFAIAILITGIVRSVSGHGSRMITGVSMLFFFISLCALFFGVKAARRDGFSASSRFWGVLIPAVAFVCYALLYIVGLLNIL